MSQPTAPARKVSLSSLNTRQASEQPFWFDYVGPDGEATGIRFGVLGSQGYTVQRAINEAVNQRRRKEAIREAEGASASPADQVTPIEDDIAFGQRLAAVRLIGWEGIEDPFTPENALLLCQTNPEIAAEVTKQSNRVGNFTKASAKA